MIDFTTYVSGSDIATKLLRESEELVECLAQLGDDLERHPTLIADIHNQAVEVKACAALRKLGVMLTNMQGD